MREATVILYLIAQIIAGEAGPICPPAGHEMVAASIATRAQVWGATWQDIARDYHARGEPSQYDIELAKKVIAHEMKPNGLPFVLSDEDVRHLQMGPPDAQVACSGGKHLNGYRRWKWPTTKQTKKRSFGRFSCWHTMRRYSPISSMTLDFGEQPITCWQ